MSFPQYPDYKDSGAEWLGEVPSHWKVERLKVLLREIDLRVGEDQLELLGLSKVQGVVRRSELTQGASESDNYGKYKVVRPGNLVMNKMQAWNGVFGLSPHEGMISPDYSVFEMIDERNSSFLTQLLRTDQAAGELFTRCRGMGTAFLRINTRDFFDVRVPLPPSTEIEGIVGFIDSETDKIGALIAEQQQLIELLKEKRQAIISHAITKGIDPQAAMKDSGDEWLGTMPAHWTKTKIKHACSHVVDCLHTTPTYDGELIYPAIRTADVERGRLLLKQARLVSQEIYEERIARLRPIEGDILYSREGERFGIAALVPAGVDLCLGQRMMMFRTVPHASAAYVMWALNSDAVYQQVLSNLGGATSPHINIGDIVNFSIPEPPLSEQKAIAEHIEIEVGALDDLAEAVATGIDLLQERRAALISAAVTGKIDVRSSAQIIPFPINRAQARGLIAAEIITHMAKRPTFGRVKLQKLAYLAEAHVGVAELGGNYLRMPAGPLDSAMVEDMEREAGGICGVVVEQPAGAGTAVTYRHTGNSAAHKPKLAQLLGPDRAAKLSDLIKDMEDLDTKSAEAVATLYAVWNDALIDGKSPDDDSIVTAFLNDWHPEKSQKFRSEELHTWLGWMRRHNLVPAGSGPKTYTGRLFV